MIKVVLTHLLQHLIAQNQWAQSLLLPFSGKSIQFNVSAINQTLVVLEDGQLAIGGKTNVPDAVISLSPTTLVRLMAQDEAAKMQIKMSGDTELAKVMAQVFSNIRWDVEDDLSHLIGDIPANQVSNAGRQFTSTVKNVSKNAIQMVTEYLQEEKLLIAKKRHVETFNAEVDILRTNIARFEKKMAKLTKRTHQLDAPITTSST